MAPNIVEFSAPQLRLQPSEIGVEATAAAARRIGGFFNQKGEALTNEGARLGRAGAAAGDVAVQHAEHTEISNGAANFMALVNGKTNEWNETAKNADPNDPSVKDKFIEENLNPALEQFQSGFNTDKGRRWAESKIDALRQHMFEKTSADMSSMAADAVHMNVNKSVNLAIGTVSNDPSSLDFLRDSIKGAIGDIADSSPNLTPQANAKVKNDLGFAAEKELVHAAISGTIAKGGDWQKIADDPKNAAFINRPELDTFAKAQKAQERADLLQQKQLETYQKQQDVSAAHEQANKTFADNVSYDATTGRIDIKPDYFKQAMGIARMPNAPEGLARTLISWGEAQQRQKKEVIATDPATKKDLYDGLFRTDNPTTEVALMKAQIDGKLSNQDFSQLHQLQKALEEKPLKGPLYQGTMEAVKGMLGVSVMPDGHERYGNFVQTFIPAYLALDDKGRAAALNLKDPNSLISKSMEGIKPTPAQLMVGHALRGTGLSPEAFESLSVPAPSGTKSNPVTLRQNGHTYQRQPDGNYKAID
jgi:hypothetical protein